MTFWTICDVAGFAADFHIPFSGVPKIEMRCEMRKRLRKQREQFLAIAFENSRY